MMMSLSRHLLLRRCSRLSGSRSVTTRPAEDAGKWRLSAAMLVERFPTVSPPLTPLEVNVTRLLRTDQDEKSLKSAHELRIEADFDRVERKKRGEIVDTAGRTAQDDEDEWSREFEAFTAAEKAEIEDPHSAERVSDRPLRLLLHKGAKNMWDLPTSTRLQGLFVY